VEWIARSSIVNLPSSTFWISVASSLRYYLSRRNFDFNNVDSPGSGNCLMINRERARRALAVTLFVFLVLIVSFGQALFKTRARPQERSRANSEAAEAPDTRIPRRRFVEAAEASANSNSTGQQGRRSIGAFFDKLSVGAPVTIAYMGGAITAGAGASAPEKTSFRALVTEWFRKHYPKSEITELNAAINNTGVSGGSIYGALRARRDVIAYKPDLVFIEFAVNDTNENEIPAKKGIEGLLRQLLVVSQPPEVVMLHATVAHRGVHAEWHDVIAAHYQIPSINMQDQVWSMIDGGKIKLAEFWPGASRPAASWKDTPPPSDAGHKLYADLIISFLTEQEKLKATPIPRTLPPPLVSDEMNYGEFKAIVEIKPQRGATKESGKERAANWRTESSNDRALPSELLVSDRAGAQVEYYFDGGVIGVSYRTGPDGGIIECLIDGKPAPPPLGHIDTYSRTPQLGARITTSGLGPGEHKLTIRALGEKNPKSSGYTVRLGYLLVGGTRPEKL
jgi:lysophospholipase L1-like esterase